MKRTDEQLEAIAEWTPAMVADFRRLEALPDDAVSEGISKHSCWSNGYDTAAETGITTANGFSDWEISRAAEYHALQTARFFELI